MRSVTELKLLLISATVVFGNSFSWNSEARAGNGQSPKAAIGNLIKQLGDKSAKVRQKSVKALAVHGKAAVPGLIMAAKNGSYRVKIASVNALGAIGPDARDAVPVLIDRLHEKGNMHLSVAAANALGNIGPAAANAAPDLLRHLAQDWGFLPQHIAPALEKLGPNAAPHVRKALDNADIYHGIPSLVAILVHYGPKHSLPLLKHRLPRIRIAACRELSTKAKVSTKQMALHPIVKLLDDDDAGVRGVAAYCLRSYGRKAIVALEKLKSLLSDKHTDVRDCAALGIGGIGQSAKSARSALIAACKDQKVRFAASSALAQIGFERDAIVGYIGTLKLPSSRHAYMAAQQLGTLGPRAKAAVPVLIKALADPSQIVRAYSAEALGRIGPAARAAIPHLEKLARRNIMAKSAADALIRIKATEAIKRLRTKPASWVIAQGKSYLIHVLRQPESDKNRLAYRPRNDNLVTHRLLHTSRVDGRTTPLFESSLSLPTRRQVREARENVRRQTGKNKRVPVFRASTQRIAGITSSENRLFVLCYNSYESLRLNPPRAQVRWSVSRRTADHTLFVFDLNSGKRLTAVTIKSKDPRYLATDTLKAGLLKVSDKTIHVLGRKFGLDGKQMGPQR